MGATMVTEDRENVEAFEKVLCVAEREWKQGIEVVNEVEGEIREIWE